jgi:hypothetical protein
MRFALLALPALLLASLSGSTGCKSPAPPKTTVDVAPQREVAEQEQRCATDADCVLVDEACCPCSAGGRRTAAAKSAVGALDARRADLCREISCAAVMSPAPTCGPAARAVCRDTLCMAEAPPPPEKPELGVGVGPIDAAPRQ